jgi:multiple sugar transport system permease protein
MAVEAKVAKAEVREVGRTHWLGQKKALAWMLMIPALVFLLLVGLYPTIYVFALSFSKYNALAGGTLEWVGLHNYIRGFQSPRFYHGLYVTAWFAVLSIAIQLVFGFVMALSLQQVGPRLRKLMTTIFLIPFMLTPAVVAILWKQIYHPTFGPLNYTLSLFGIEGPAWASDPIWALPALVIADIWQWTPFMTILLFAGLQSLSRELYEAAYVDGATPWQAFRDHTIPLMKPFIFLAVFLRFIDAFKLFDLVFIVTRGGPGDLTESIAYYTYVMGFKYIDLGLAAALSVLQLIIIIIMGKVLLGQLSRVEQAGRGA